MQNLECNERVTDYELEYFRDQVNNLAAIVHELRQVPAGRIGMNIDFLKGTIDQMISNQVRHTNLIKELKDEIIKNRKKIVELQSQLLRIEGKIGKIENYIDS